jgi:mRNA interferase MazF
MPSRAAAASRARSKPEAFYFGAIILAPFPFTSQVASKQRPAVVVSSRGYNLERPDLIMMAVTSQLRPTPAFGEVWLRDSQGAGLLKPSAVNPVFATLEQKLVIRQLGVLAAEDQDALRAAIINIIG